MTNSTTNNTVQVALVGGRQAPNVIGALVLRPSRVELVASADASHNIPWLLDSLDGIESLSLPTKEDVEVVDAYDFEANLATYQQICKQYRGHLIDFNLTGSTKVMAIAAYEVARQYNNARAFYVDTRNNQLLWLEGKGQKVSTSFQISIEEYLGTYGRKPESKFKFETLSFNEEQAVQAAQILGNSAPQSRRLLHQIRKIQGTCPRQVVLSSPTPQEQAWIEELSSVGVIDKGSQEETFIVRANSDKDFLTGDWLELYVWYEANKQKDKDGTPLFSECSFNLEIPSKVARREIDVACLYQAQLIHCSCKTGRDAFDKKNLDELRAVSSLIGGRFCSRVYITQKAIKNYQDRENFLSHAQQHEIVVVTGESLSKVGEILKKQAVRPDYWRI